MTALRAAAGEPDPGDAWIAHAWRIDARGVLLCPSSEGITALRGMGRNAWISQLSERLGVVTPPAHWRLLDRAPDGLEPAQVDALLQAPRPRQPEVLEESGADGHQHLRLRVPLDLEQLDGHFASAPVLPGFMQVGWALALAASRIGTPESCLEIEALKFQQFLRPGDEVNLELQLHRDTGKLHFAYRCGMRACSSGRLLLETRP